jgi:hypothetical protein
MSGRKQGIFCTRSRVTTRRVDSLSRATTSRPYTNVERRVSLVKGHGHGSSGTDANFSLAILI